MMKGQHQRIRELAERASSVMRVRLLWRQGTTVVWVEVSSPESDQVLAILVPPERALDAFHHPYAYASRRNRFSPKLVGRRLLSACNIERGSGSL
jgi:hypothetical protein